MANNRVAIRQAIRTLLVTGATAAGPNVYTNRETRLWESELPAIILRTADEPAVPESMRSSPRFIRTLQLHIVIKVKATDAVDDVLDALCAEVETIMSANPGLSGTVMGSTQTNTTVTLNSDGESDVGEANLTYELTYIS